MVYCRLWPVAIERELHFWHDQNVYAGWP
jgi:hypothetical protein